MGHLPAQRRRILIVDDEEGVATSLRDGLVTLPDCEVSVATGGKQALRLVEQQPFNLLITDYQMPDMNGLTLAFQVRQLHPQTAIIMLTAYGSNALYECAACASVRRILRKPAKLVEIRSAVLEALTCLGSC